MKTKSTSLATALTVVLACVLVSPSLAAEPSAAEIVDKALQTNALGFREGTARMSLTIEDKAGNQRQRQLEVRSKKISDQTRTLVELTAPKQLRGQSFLFAENADGADDVWMHLPAFGVTRRIEGSDKDGAFLGSHFTYADLESSGLRDAKYSRKKDEKIGPHAVFVIESRPLKGSQSEYAKVVTFIRKDDFMPLKLKFYATSGDLQKTLFVEKLDKTEDGQTYVKQMTLRPTKGGFTTIAFASLQTDQPIPDSAFSRDQLGK